jgi:hypothetical protein
LLGVGDKLSEDVMSQAALAKSSFAPTHIRLAQPDADRRRHRRVDVEHLGYTVERIEGLKIQPQTFGRLVNLSAGGMLIKCAEASVKVGSQIRVRMTLPAYAGISPFVSSDGSGTGSETWIGWISIVRIARNDDGSVNVAARISDMREIDRGMLGLYLSAQPLAA